MKKASTDDERIKLKLPKKDLNKIKKGRKLRKHLKNLFDKCHDKSYDKLVGSLNLIYSDQWTFQIKVDKKSFLDIYEIKASIFVDDKEYDLRPRKVSEYNKFYGEDEPQKCGVDAIAITLNNHIEYCKIQAMRKICNSYTTLEEDEDKPPIMSMNLNEDDNNILSSFDDTQIN